MRSLCVQICQTSGDQQTQIVPRHTGKLGLMNLRGKKERSNARGELRLRQTVREIGIKVAQQLLEEEGKMEE